MTIVRVLEPLARRRYLLLALWALVCFLTRAGVDGGDWHYFVSGSDLLVGRHPANSPYAGGLHLYANYPEYQIGPLALLAAGFFRLVGFGHGHLVAQVVMCSMGPVLVYAVERAAVAVRGLRAAAESPLLPLAVLAGGFVFVRSWIDVAGPIAHVDDVIALAAGAAAVWAVAARRPTWAGIAVGIAIAAKPWGILELPLLFALGRRGTSRGLTAAVVTSALAWLPFLIVDPASISSLGRFSIWNRADSALRVLGVHDSLSPGWLRPTQMALGMGLALIAVRRGRWAGALMGAFAVRIALDPGAWPYYTPELVLAALVWDLLGSRRALPVWTFVMFFGLEGARLVVSTPSVRGAERLALAVAAAAAIFLLPKRRRLVQAAS